MSEKLFEDFEQVTPTDDTDINQDGRPIYVGTGGDLVVRKASGGSTFTMNVPDGGLLRLKVYSIDSTGTTADDIYLLKDV